MEESIVHYCRITTEVGEKDVLLLTFGPEWTTYHDIVINGRAVQVNPAMQQVYNGTFHKVRNYLVLSAPLFFSPGLPWPADWLYLASEGFHRNDDHPHVRLSRPFRQAIQAGMLIATPGKIKKVSSDATKDDFIALFGPVQENLRVHADIDRAIFTPPQVLPHPIPVPLYQSLAIIMKIESAQAYHRIQAGQIIEMEAGDKSRIYRKYSRKAVEKRLGPLAAQAEHFSIERIHSQLERFPIKALSLQEIQARSHRSAPSPPFSSRIAITQPFSLKQEGKAIL